MHGDLSLAKTSCCCFACHITCVTIASVAILTELTAQLCGKAYSVYIVRVELDFALRLHH